MQTTDLLARMGGELLQMLGTAIAMLTFVGLFGFVVSRFATAWAKARLERYRSSNPATKVDTNNVHQFGNAVAVAVLFVIILIGGVPVFINTIWQDGETNWTAAVILSMISAAVVGYGIFFLGLAISIFRASRLQDKATLADETTRRLGFDRETERL